VKKILLIIFLFEIFFVPISADELRQRIEWRSIGIGGGGWFTTVTIETLNPGTVYVGRFYTILTR